MRVAALDLGSNTSLLLIADMNGDKIQRVLLDETRITKLGQGVHAHRRFHPEALQRMQTCLNEYAQHIRAHQCAKVIAVATSAARDVSNGHELIEMGRTLNIPIHIIPGEREAQLTYLGALSDREGTPSAAVVDVGGGSTEIILPTLQGPRGKSVDVGSVRLTEMFVREQPIRTEALRALKDHVKSSFAAAGIRPTEVQELIAVAGTPTTLAALDQRRDFEENLINGYRLTLKRIEEWIGMLADMSVEQREKLPGMQPKRADVIVTGATILAGAIAALGGSEVTVSTRGVRYGVAQAWQEF